MTQIRTPLKTTAIEKVYPFLVSYMKTHKGVAPSLDEVADKFKRTKEWVRYCYKILVKENLIRVDRYKQRGVLIIGK